jgi:hypothetical protein
MADIPEMSSEDLYGVLSAIIDHWELRGVGKAKKTENNICNGNAGHLYRFK